MLSAETGMRVYCRIAKEDIPIERRKDLINLYSNIVDLDESTPIEFDGAIVMNIMIFLFWILFIGYFLFADPHTITRESYWAMAIFFCLSVASLLYLRIGIKKFKKRNEKKRELAHTLQSQISNPAFMSNLSLLITYSSGVREVVKKFLPESLASLENCMV